METIVISLPDSQRVYVEEQIRLGGYNNASEYFSFLVERERQARQRLETMLIEGIESGPAEPMRAEDWKEIRRAVRERTQEKVKSDRVRAGTKVLRTRAEWEELFNNELASALASSPSSPKTTED